VGVHGEPAEQRRVWLASIVAALAGWLFVVLLLGIGLRPLGAALALGFVCALAVATAYALTRRRSVAAVLAFTFACALLEWPLLALLSLLLLSRPSDWG
jgi:hypothetical protein